MCFCLTPTLHQLFTHPQIEQMKPSISFLLFSCVDFASHFYVGFSLYFCFTLIWPLIIIYIQKFCQAAPKLFRGEAGQNTVHFRAHEPHIWLMNSWRMVFIFLLELVMLCGAGHLQAGEGEVPCITESEVGRIPVLPSGHWGHGSPLAFHEIAKTRGISEMENVWVFAIGRLLTHDALSQRLLHQFRLSDR